jgi:hypothetical protein
MMKYTPRKIIKSSAIETELHCTALHCAAKVNSERMNAMVDLIARSMCYLELTTYPPTETSLFSPSYTFFAVAKEVPLVHS